MADNHWFQTLSTDHILNVNKCEGILVHRALNMSRNRRYGHMDPYFLLIQGLRPSTKWRSFTMEIIFNVLHDAQITMIQQ